MKKPYDSLLPSLFGSDSFNSGESVITSRLLPLVNVKAFVNVNTLYNQSRISCDDNDVQEVRCCALMCSIAHFITDARHVMLNNSS
jgi:hypothetical protein